jgi:hypothetical protein
MRKDSEPQQGAQNRPSHTHAKRSRDVQGDVARQVRPLQWQPAADPKHDGRKHGVE